jgi:hypothetical protein
VQVLNRVLSTLLALVLLLGGLLAVVEIVLAAVGRPHWLVPHQQWSSWLAEQTFASAVVRAILIGLAVLALLLLVAALRRGRPGALALPARAAGVQVTASRRGIERTLARAAQRPDGVQSARVHAGRRKVRVKATTALRSPGDLRPQVTAAVDERLDELGLAGTVRSRVTVSRKGTR